MCCLTSEDLPDVDVDSDGDYCDIWGGCPPFLPDREDQLYGSFSVVALAGLFSLFYKAFWLYYNIHNYFIHFKYLLVDFRCLVESFLTQMELVNYA